MSSRGSSAFRPRHPLAAVLFDMDGLLGRLRAVVDGGRGRAGSVPRGRPQDDRAQSVGSSAPRLDLAVPAILRLVRGAPSGPAAAPPTRWRSCSRGWSTLFVDRLAADARRAGPPRRPTRHRAAHRAGVLVLPGARRCGDAARSAPERFDVTVAGDEVTTPSPTASPICVAAAALGVSPPDCVVFEDAPSGSPSGEAAGCLAIGIPGTHRSSPRPAARQRVARRRQPWLLSAARGLRKASSAVAAHDIGAQLRAQAFALGRPGSASSP